MNPFGDLQMYSDMLSNVPDALRGSAAGTAGLPMDLVNLLASTFSRSRSPLSNVGTSDWFGQLFGANTQSPTFDIARMTAMAPPMVGAAGKGLAAIDRVGESGKIMSPYMEQMLSRLKYSEELNQKVRGLESQHEALQRAGNSADAARVKASLDLWRNELDVFTGKKAPMTTDSWYGEFLRGRD